MLYDINYKPDKTMAYIRIFSGKSNFLERVKSKEVLVDIVFVSEETYKEAIELGWDENEFRSKHPGVDIYYEEGHNNRILIAPKGIA